MHLFFQEISSCYKGALSLANFVSQMVNVDVVVVVVVLFVCSFFSIYM